MELRTEFAKQAARKEEAFSELCRRYEISRVTGYKWVERYEAEGKGGMDDRSRAPRHSPQAIDERIAEQLLELRRAHPRWGPKKLRAWWEQREPATRWPAQSTIAELLKREGLSQTRRKRVRTPVYEQPLAHATAPNQVWCIDFKGWFRTADGTRCDPLTLTDASSRYLLRACLVEKTDGERVRAVLEAAFREYGMPEAMRSDNGAPFASRAPAGLSRLSMWWLRLGIRHERIEPGCPQQNGRHERMHQTLKQEVASPPAAHWRAQQQALMRFQQCYNDERPHEALGQRPPSEFYMASARVYPSRVPEPAYPEDVSQYRRVTASGELHWKGQPMFVSEVLGGERVGLREVEQDWWEMFYGPVRLGCLDTHALRFAAAGGSARRNKR